MGSGQEAFRFSRFSPPRVKGYKEMLEGCPIVLEQKQTLQQLVSHRYFKLYIKALLFKIVFDKFCIEKRLEGKSDELKIASQLQFLPLPLLSGQTEWFSNE